MAKKKIGKKKKASSKQQQKKERQDGDHSSHTSTSPSPDGGAPRLEVEVTPLDHLLSMRRPHQIAAELANSLFSLRSRLAKLELERLNYESGTAGANAMVRIAQERQEKQDKLEMEIIKTEKMTRRLLLMSKVVDRVVSLRETVFAEVREKMEAEVETLRDQIAVNEARIRERYVGRVNLLHRYWLWRTLQELGDVNVGTTFEGELARGPRYRTVGLQNNILSDTLEQQLTWLRRFGEKEAVFRGHVQRLDTFVERLTDVSEVLEDTLTCAVCGLLFEDPVLFWPCGHTFCLVCFDSLCIAPSLFRCPTCGSMGSEGYVHNLLIAESVAKWVFKDAGYSDVHGALSLIRLHLSKFRKDVIMVRLTDLRQRLAEARERETSPEKASEMSITYRLY
ncbi:zinc finger protein [Trypanosoma melophagium]|uniref:zinc finger protein n=1 Tax=Trypanosoma melophagium TaxID=715481 RepID=UPI00351A64F8|nr:zinc finger protein [Trypanosoma melophagium]